MTTPVNFEIAKLLKEKGFDKPTLHFFFEDGVLIENSYQDTVGMDYGKEFEVEFFELTDNWNEGWVKKKDGSMCFGCDKSKDYLDIYSAPTVAEVVMWLSEKQIDVCHIVNWSFGIRTYRAGIVYIENNKIESAFLRPENEKVKFIEFNSPTKAYEAAIEYTLNNLI